MRLNCHLSVFVFAALPVYSFGGVSLSPLLGLSLHLCLACGFSLGDRAFFCGTMPSDLPCTIVLDVSKFPATASRVDSSSAIVNRFTAFKVNAVQFVGNLARITFSSASDLDAVMRFESVRVGMLIVSCAGVALARRKFLCAVTL